MKTIIIAVNSKYIHSSLAPWYLKAACKSNCGTIKVMEFTINDNPDSVLSRIYAEGCDIAAFSCYIWNINFILKVAENLKKILPNIKIVLGGPEVSYDPQQVLELHPFVDFVIFGEGESAFNELLGFLNGVGKELYDIKGLSYREDGRITVSKIFPLEQDLDSIPSPYNNEMLSCIGNRIVYFESSRGCPFSCSYCISSTFEGVRYFSLDRVKKDLRFLMAAGVKLVKFVDRTFNCNKDRAKSIFEFIINNAGNTVFHFEAAADLFDEETIEILSRAPKGLIQFEIGIQSTNEVTLEAVKRKTNIKKVLYYVKRLMELGNIHIHVDLIAGLPFEDYSSFRKSFNDVYNLFPHQLQLGFLKMLKGSAIRNESLKYGYKFREYPPYEILGNEFLSYEDIVKLKRIEEVLERYYNSARFERSLKYIINGFFDSPFEFFEEFSLFYLKEGCFERSISSRELYTILLKFIAESNRKVDLTLLNELLKFDFLISDNTNNLPVGIERIFKESFKTKCFEFLKTSDNIAKFLPDFCGEPPKKIFNRVHFELFRYDITENVSIPTKKDTVILFNYSEKNPITEHYSYIKIQLP
ncbi:MAG TPA: B12-binding domain-containing radical SAM protein [Acetivibrio sp.]|nr:B12-binding domain-containing radical SAM protein [Acetivibrio sp.]HPT90551.1 B12-binding domain-containing radical SAM protein [Acetivibrio sp.]HQA56808.1 B12-binding domain-containing radical SAM protein [Acetivibrio sp.]